MNKKRVGILLALPILAGIVWWGYGDSKKNTRRIERLRTIQAEDVSLFALYPNVIGPYGTPHICPPQDPMVEEFFPALRDLQMSPDRAPVVASHDHRWFVEVTSEGSMIQTQFYIPSSETEVVMMLFCEKTQTHGSYYGTFQRHLLYAWYQTYHHRWLSSSLMLQCATAMRNSKGFLSRFARAVSPGEESGLGGPRAPAL